MTENLFKLNYPQLWHQLLFVSKNFINALLALKYLKIRSVLIIIPANVLMNLYLRVLIVIRPSNRMETFILTLCVIIISVNHLHGLTETIFVSHLLERILGLLLMKIHPSRNQRDFPFIKLNLVLSLAHLILCSAQETQR